MELPTQVKEADKKADELEKSLENMPNNPADNAPDDTGTLNKPVSPDSDKDWKAEFEKAQHKYDVLQGKYNAEVPRLSQELEELKSKNVETPADDDVSDEDLFSGISDDAVDPQAIDKLVTEKIKPVEEVVNTLANETYTERLTSKVPDWKNVYNEDEFIQWLNVVEPAAGKTRLELAKEAETKRDANRVAWFIQQYKSSKSKPPDKPNVEDYVAPDSGSSKVNYAEEVPRGNLTEEQIKNYYSALARGKVSEERQKVMEARIAQYMNRR